MPCLILQNEHGSQRLVPSNQPYQLLPGEYLAGTSAGCDPAPSIEALTPAKQKVCVQLQDLAGQIRLVPAGTPYVANPGEHVVGVDPTCGGTIAVIHPGKPNMGALRQELDVALGGGAGDWIKTLAKPLAQWMGKTNCSACEARRIVTNAYAQLKQKHGQFEALKIITDLWHMSMKSSGEDVLVELKRHLGNEH